MLCYSTCYCLEVYVVLWFSARNRNTLNIWVKIIVGALDACVLITPLFYAQVICVHDVSSIYRVPLLLEEQGVVDYFRHRLDLPIERQPRRMLMKWKEMADRWAALLGTQQHTLGLVSVLVFWLCEMMSVISCSSGTCPYMLTLFFPFAQSPIQTMNVSRGEKSTAAADHLCQCLTTLIVQNLILTSSLNLPCFRLKPSPVVLAQQTLLKSLSLCFS